MRHWSELGLIHGVVSARVSDGAAGAEGGGFAWISVAD